MPFLANHQEQTSITVLDHFFSSLLTASFYNLVMDIVLFMDMNFTEIYVFKNDDILKLESFMFGTSLVDKSVGQNVYRHQCHRHQFHQFLCASSVR